MRKPANFHELFEFYYAECKPLYGRLSADNSLPTELLVELNAALDHISRHWHYGEDEVTVVNQATGHLKRSTFDVFKLILKETRDHYDELQKVPVHLIDNGKFAADMHIMWNQIRSLAIEARTSEGDTRDANAWDHAFEKWKQVFILCQKFDREFFLSHHIPWAKMADKKMRAINFAVSFILGIITGIIANFIFIRWFPT